jgi:hypothetical protein
MEKPRNSSRIHDGVVVTWDEGMLCLSYLSLFAFFLKVFVPCSSELVVATQSNPVIDEFLLMHTDIL